MKTRCWLVAFGCVACSGAGAPEPASPALGVTPTATTAAPGAAGTTTPVPEPAEPVAAESTPAPSGAAGSPNAPAPSAEPEPPKPTLAPVAMVTARDVAFLIDFANSAPRKAAETACDKQANADLDARSACLQKARDKFQADVLRFQTDTNGRSELAVYKRAGSNLSEVYASPIEFADETQNSVRVRFLGKTRGQRPLFKSKRDLVLFMPNDYSIELDDPELGKLVYSAKIGLVSK